MRTRASTNSPGLEMCHLLLVAFSILLSFAAMPNAGHAQSNTPSLIAALQRTDALVSGGSVSYTERTHWLVGDNGQPSKVPEPPRFLHASIAWNRDGHWRYEGRVDGESNETTELHVGGALVEGSRYSTVVKNDVSSKFSDFDRLMGVSPGPCFVMGRGFSRLNNLHMVGPLTVTGTAKDGSEITATFDPAHQFIAKTMQRRGGGKLYNIWTLTNPVRFGNVWLPGRVACESHGRSGVIGTTADIRVVAASFQPVSPTVFEAPLNNGLPIMDNRLGSPVGFKVAPQGVNDLDTLMVETRKQDAQFRRGQEVAAVAHRERRLSAITLCGLLFVACAIAVVAFWRGTRGSS